MANLKFQYYVPLFIIVLLRLAELTKY